ncbi:MAG: Coenzyme F420 hydrogenase/dehydrogenase, beta subunit C-terminal domain [Chloroflexi bacterium]|nr:Coenzyme F420 hydrogenase/dehydrogenase, beta subunit C-terminal domain [Chloroflexota bacterium]
MPDRLLTLEGKKNVKRLFDVIVDTAVCSGCGGCVVVCPVDALGYDVFAGDGREIDLPYVLDTCIDCLLCMKACPRLEYQYEDLDKLVCTGVEDDLVTNEVFGDYVEIVAARATHERVLKAGQDGAVVTALIAWGMEKGHFDGALTAERDERWMMYPKIVRTVDELLRCAGSGYTYAPNSLALREAAASGLQRMVFVGVPCEVSAVRKLEIAKSKRGREMTKNVALQIGLMCSETFTYDGFMIGKLQNEMGLRLEDIVKINVKGRVLVYMRSGEVISVPLKQARPFAREGCHYCQDFAAEYADLSVGGLGGEGWTITVLRTKRGRELFYEAVRDGVIEVQGMDDFGFQLNLLEKLAAKQRARPNRKEALAVAVAENSA